jgi:ATP synthase I chain
MMDHDRFLRRVERDALIACAAMTAVALVVWRGRWDVALGVAAGGLIVWVSYSGIKSGVDAVVRRGAAGRGTRGWALVKFFTRYAIVAVAAYLLMVRVRLHPAGVVAGASSLVLAAAAEAVRFAHRAH